MMKSKILNFIVLLTVSYGMDVRAATFETQGKGIRLTCRTVSDATLFWGDIYVCEYRIIRKNIRNCALQTKYNSNLAMSPVDCALYDEVVKNTL